MKILVTGGAGFIGSHVVDGYLEEGHEVVVVDDLSTGKPENVNPRATFHRMDIRSEEMIRIMAKESPDVINHHAAQISVPDSVSDPLKDADINIRGLLNILESAVKNNVKKVLFISSGGAIYGEADQYPTSEDFLPRPLSPYAVSKYASEYYLAYYQHHYGLPFTTLRYANVYGPRQIPKGEAGVVSIFMTNLLHGKPCTLNHFPDEPSGMTRDYCYVGDIVKANARALAAGSGETFNIGTGQGTKTLELFNIIYSSMKKMNPPLSEELSRPESQQARPGDIRRSCLVIDKARRELGWEPGMDLERGIGMTLEWWMNEVGEQRDECPRDPAGT